MVHEWKKEDGQQAENARQQNAPHAASEAEYRTPPAEQPVQADAGPVTRQDETSESTGDDASFGRSSADGSAFIGSQSAGSEEDLAEQDPQSDFAQRDALTQENDDGMGEAGR